VLIVKLGDYGDRVNRKHARMKYTLLDLGLDHFKTLVEEKLGYQLEGPRETLPFTTNGDAYEWVQGIDGLFYKTLFIEGGRVKDTPSYQLRTALRELALLHKGDFRFTGNPFFPSWLMRNFINTTHTFLFVLTFNR
jgi:sulfite reductase (NADPH) hemoprotein beta-component